MKHFTPCIVLALLLLSFSAAAPAAEPQEIGLYIDGQQVDFVSQVRGGRLPSLLVDGHAMIPVRLLDERLGADLDLHLTPWGVYLINDIGFKVGEKVAYSRALGIGGDRAWLHRLSVAPIIVEGRAYVPAREFLELTGHKVGWDQEKRALLITTRKQPGQS